MATKVVKELIATANSLLEKVNDAELKDSIEALEFLGEDANGNSQEYKDLKEVVERIKATLEKNTNNKTVEVSKKKAKRLNYAGIKQIGSLWYSIKDNYRKPFSTADECAEYFNKE